MTLRSILFAKLIWQNTRETRKQIYYITFVSMFRTGEKDTHQKLQVLKDIKY